MAKKAIEEDEELDEVVDDDENFGEGLESPEDSSEEAPAKGTEEDEDPEEDEPEEDESPANLRSIFAEQNINLPEDADEIEVVRSLLGGIGQYRQQLQQYQAQRQQDQEQLRQYQYMLAQRQQAPPETTPQKPPELTGLLSHWKKVPDWDDNWERLVRKDENGNLVPIPGAAPDLPQKYLERLRWEEQAQRTFFNNPQQFIHEALQAHPEYQKTRQELSAIRQELVSYQDRVLADQLVNQVSGVIRDDKGQFTPAGQAYLAVVNEMEKAGITNSAFVNQIAQIAMSGYAQQAQAPAKEEAPAETKKKRQLNFAKRASEQKRNRGTKARPKLNTKEDMDRYAQQLMEAEGIDPHAVPAL